MPATRIFPLDAQGQRSDRSPQEVLWTSMSDVIVKDGFLVPRPGLVFINSGFRWEEYPTDTAEATVPVVITEIENPGEDDAGREGYAYISETLRPNANTEIVAGWTGAYTDIDETTTLDNAYLASSTLGSQESIGFTNITKDFDRIDTLLLRGVVDFTGQSAGAPYAIILTFYARIGGTNYEVGSVTVTTMETGTADQLQFALQIPEDPSLTNLTQKQWTTAQVNGLEMVVELTSGNTEFALRLIPDGDGMYTDGGAYTSFDAPLPGHTGLLDSPNNVDSGVTLAAGEKQSFTFSAFPDYTNAGAMTADLSDFFVFLGFSGQTWDQPATFNFVYYPTAGSASNPQTLFSKTFTFEGSQDDTYPFLAEAITGNNPYTGSAWTESDITSGEFSVEVTSGELVLTSANFLPIMTSNETVNCNIDQLALDVYGINADEDVDDVVLGIAPLWSTALHHFRWSGMDTAEDAVITDVTNSVGFTTPPTQYVDHAILYGQVYMVNGTDATRRYPNEAGTNLYEALTANNADGATKITGRTVAAFADRILYGWVTDNTTVTPERIAYSKIFDGGTHNDNSAGDFDLIDTPGGVVRLLPLNEDVCAAYKSAGIYVLRRTGNTIAPIVPDRIDLQTGLLAPGTVKNVLGPQRNPVQIFLGRNPVDGFNVFMFDGSAVTPVGDHIKKELRDSVEHEYINTSFAVIDNQAGYYWLFVPARGETFPTGGYMMNLRNLQWHTFNLPDQLAASCGGVWTLPNMDDWKWPARFGYPTAVVGSIDGMLRRFEHNITHDVLKDGETEPDTVAKAVARYDFYAAANDNADHGSFNIYFDPELITGDLLLNPDEPNANNVLRSIHLQYRNVGVTKVTVSASTDGGITYDGTASYALGTTASDGKLMYQQMDMDTPVTGRRHRIKLTFDWDLNDDLEQVQYGDYPFKIEEIWLDYEPAGEDI